MNTKTIVISGITSALGISLARLLLHKGYRVRGFARRIEKAERLLDHPNLELISADLLDRPYIQSICSDVEGVIHLAALSSLWGSDQEFYRVNVEGTRTIVEASIRAKIKRFVHVSTPSLYFDFRDQFNIEESAFLPSKYVNSYTRTKKQAEDIVDQALQKGLECITLRPRAIFGPEDQALLPRVLKTCEEKGVPCFGKNSPIVDVTYVDNVAHALWLALEAPSILSGQKYNITNGEPIALWDLLGQLLAKLSIPYLSWKVPYPIAYAVAWASEWKSQFTGKEPLLTRYGVGVMTYSQTLSIEKAKRELQYVPSISLKEGIKRYAEWRQTL